MQHDVMMATLKGLKLYGMAQAADELYQQGVPSYESAQLILGSLLKAHLQPVPYHTALILLRWPSSHHAA